MDHLDLFRLAVRQARWQLAYAIIGGAFVVAAFVCFGAHALDVPDMLTWGFALIVIGGVLFIVSDGKGKEAALTFELAHERELERERAGPALGEWR